MPSTTFHLPDDLLARVDAAAERRGVSRNRFVIRACERAVEEDLGAWPAGFFERRFSDAELRLLAEATGEVETIIVGHRRNRGAPLV